MVSTQTKAKQFPIHIERHSLADENIVLLYV